MNGNEQNTSSTNIPWDGINDRRTNSSGSSQAYAGDWFQYKYMFFEKFNSLEKKVDEIEKSVDDIKTSFIKLQTKIMVVSGLSGVISAALITAVFTSLADKFIK